MPTSVKVLPPAPIEYARPRSSRIDCQRRLDVPPPMIVPSMLAAYRSLLKADGHGAATIRCACSSSCLRSIRIGDAIVGDDEGAQFGSIFLSPLLKARAAISVNAS